MSIVIDHPSGIELMLIDRARLSAQFASLVANVTIPKPRGYKPTAFIVASAANGSGEMGDEIENWWISKMSSRKADNSETVKVLSILMATSPIAGMRSFTEPSPWPRSDGGGNNSKQLGESFNVRPLPLNLVR
jgi:hypothetical protein